MCNTRTCDHRSLLPLAVSSIPTRARQNAQNAPPSVSAPVGKRPGIQPGNLRERREEEEVAEVRQFGAKEEAVRQSSTEEEEETEERKEFATPKEKPGKSVFEV